MQLNKSIHLISFLQKAASRIAILSLLIVISSCNSTAGVFKNEVSIGRITTENVVITAEDNSFTLKSGDTWTPPFQNNYFKKFPKQDLIHLYDKAIKVGAKKVKIKVPYQTEELFGVLMLNKTPKGCSSAVARSYQITIPEEYVKNAQNGKISALYEYYSNCGKRNVSAETWILWISDIPF